MILTSNMFEGRSGDALAAVIDHMAPDHIQITQVELVKDVANFSNTLCIFYRDKVQLGHSRRLPNDDCMTFRLTMSNPELPAEVILAKMALL